MNPTTFPSPFDQVRLHWLSLIGEARHQHLPHIAFHLKGIVRALKQMLA
jgi:hypothetical protein